MSKLIKWYRRCLIVLPYLVVVLSYLLGIALIIFAVFDIGTARLKSFGIVTKWLASNGSALRPRLLYIALSYLTVITALIWGVSGFSRFAPPPRQAVSAQNNQTATPNK